MFPLSVLTWRLNNLGNKDFEEYIVPEHRGDEFNSFLCSFGSYFYLHSCQRIVFVFDTTDNHVIKQFYEKYYEFVQTEKMITPEIFKGKEAIEHLSIIVSSLDSIVIGETEIQGQFKNAYKVCNNNMSPFLIDTMSKIIHIGKKIREHPLLSKGRISTISIAYELLLDEFTRSNSIGIIGTGKMAKGIIRYLNQNHQNLVIYTNSHERAKEGYLDFDFRHISEIVSHDILITATDVKQLINHDFLMKYPIEDTKYILDLGVPRNCHPAIQDGSNIEIFTMEDLFAITNQNKDENVIEEIFKEVNYHVNVIIREYYRSKNKDKIVSLRKDLFNEANQRKTEILKNLKGEKEFDQFINSLIHISQQHLERNMQSLLELDQIEEN